MSRLLDQIRNAARLRLGAKPVADNFPEEGELDSEIRLSSPNVLIQAIQRQAQLSQVTVPVITDVVEDPVLSELQAASLAATQAETDREAAQLAMAMGNTERALRIASDKRAQAEAQAMAAAQFRAIEEKKASNELRNTPLLSERQPTGTLRRHSVRVMPSKKRLRRRCNPGLLRSSVRKQTLNRAQRSSVRQSG